MKVINLDDAVNIAWHYLDSLEYGNSKGVVQNWIAEEMENTAFEVETETEGFEWCTDCKEYDQEKNCCHRWSKVIGQTVEELKATERTAKVIEHDASVTDTDGYKYHRSEYLCGACKKKVLGGDEYCSHCGCRLDWNEDIPMEYFESGGI